MFELVASVVFAVVLRYLFAFIVSQHFQQRTLEEDEKDSQDEKREVKGEDVRSTAQNIEQGKSKHGHFILKRRTRSLSESLNNLYSKPPPPLRAQKSMPAFSFINLSIPLPLSTQTAQPLQSGGSSPPTPLYRQSFPTLFITNPTVSGSDTPQLLPHELPADPPLRSASQPTNGTVVEPIHNILEQNLNQQNPWTTTPIYNGPVYNIREPIAQRPYSAFAGHNQTKRKMKKLAARLGHRLAQFGDSDSNEHVESEQRAGIGHIENEVVKGGGNVTTAKKGVSLNNRVINSLGGRNRLVAVEENEQGNSEAPESMLVNRSLKLGYTAVQVCYGEDGHGSWRKRLKLRGRGKDSWKRSVASFDWRGESEEKYMDSEVKDADEQIGSPLGRRWDLKWRAV